MCVVTGAEPVFNMAGLFTTQGLIFLQDVDCDVNIAGYVNFQGLFTGAVMYTEPESQVRMKQYVLNNECCDVQDVHPMHVGDFVYFETSDHIDVDALTGYVQSIDFETNVVVILQCEEGGEPVNQFPFEIQRCKVWRFYI
jgi:hypothetical protein